MRSPIAWALALSALFSVSAFAADDDDLAPLPTKKAPPKVPAKAPRPPAKRPPPPAKKQPAPPPVAADDDLAPLPVALRGDVSVKTTVSNATLVIDGKEVGVLPLPPQTLTTGEHQVMVKRVGYANFVKRVNVTAGKLELDAKLQPLSAVLSVTSDVVGAEVFIDGKLIGNAPLTDFEVPAKTVELIIRKDGMADDKRSLTLVAGRDYPVSVKFKGGDVPLASNLTPEVTDGNPIGIGTTITPAKPIYSRWYFWAGAAAVVAAAVGTGVAVSSKKGTTEYPLDAFCKGFAGGCPNGGKPNTCMQGSGVPACAVGGNAGTGVLRW